MLTSRKPMRCARKFDIIIFYWIIIELIYQIVYFLKFNMCYLKLYFKLEVFCSVIKYILQPGIIYSEICMKTQCNNFFFFF